MDTRKIMDIIAYYLSEYDREAFQALGYETQSAGFEGIASLFGKKESYLRRLRDEYDVVTNSTRNGQRNRPPRARISRVKDHLVTYSFEELTEMVRAFIENTYIIENDAEVLSEERDTQPMSEAELENIINFRDDTATIRVKTGNSKVRVYDTSIIRQLKKLYKGCCQLCGEKVCADFGVDICEAHHIEHYAESHNNDASNIIIVCPNHHRLIHKQNPVFIAEEGCFLFKNGKKLVVKEDYHLM